MKGLENRVSELKKKKKDIIILCRLTNQEKFPLKKREKEKNNRRKIVPMKIQVEIAQNLGWTEIIKVYNKLKSAKERYYVSSDKIKDVQKCKTCSPQFCNSQTFYLNSSG